MTPEQLAITVKHFLIAAVWVCDDDNEAEPDASAIEHAQTFCADFVAAFPEFITHALTVDEYGAHPDCGNVHPICASIGHDIYLSCSGQGVGFGDRQMLGKWGAKVADAIRADWRRWHLEGVADDGILYLN